MPFSMSPSQLANLVNEVPGIRAVHDCRCRPVAAKCSTRPVDVQRVPVFDSVRPVTTLLEFG